MYTEEEFLKIYYTAQYIPEPDRLFFALIFYCGLRMQEVLGMKREDFVNSKIYIKRSVIRFCKKTVGTSNSYQIKALKHRADGEYRVFTLPEAVRYQYLNKTTPLPNGFFYKPQFSYREIWKKAVTKSNLPHRIPYSLRASCVTKWLQVLPISEIPTGQEPLRR